MEANTNYLSHKNTENPDVASQRAGPDVYIDLFSIKPNKHGLSKELKIQLSLEKGSDNCYLTLARSGTKAARALHLLLSDPKKVARNQQTPS
jgi:hypothetical protein